MNINEFIDKRPYLYHLTSTRNAELILAQRRLYSANQLIDLSDNPAYQQLKRQKRLHSTDIIVDHIVYSLRDQQPISELALSKCLTDNWEVPDFIEHLNERVFMWPTLDRLYRHYNRYVNEAPTILRVSTRDVIRLNQHVKFCRLNSGATRANSYLGGKAPERGQNTFLSSQNYELPIGSVAEVTFERMCNLECDLYTSNTPEGEYVFCPR